VQPVGQLVHPLHRSSTPVSIQRDHRAGQRGPDREKVTLQRRQLRTRPRPTGAGGAGGSDGSLTRVA